MPVKDTLRVLVATDQTGTWKAQMLRSVEADRDASVVGNVPPSEVVTSLGQDHPDIVSLDMTGSRTAGRRRASSAISSTSPPYPSSSSSPPVSAGMSRWRRWWPEPPRS